MKVGSKGLRMTSGEVKHFDSTEKRDNFERVAAAYSHGWKGPSGGQGSGSGREAQRGRKGKM